MNSHAFCCLIAPSDISSPRGSADIYIVQCQFRFGLKINYRTCNKRIVEYGSTRNPCLLKHLVPVILYTPVLFVRTTVITDVPSPQFHLITSNFSEPHRAARSEIWEYFLNVLLSMKVNSS